MIEILVLDLAKELNRQLKYKTPAERTAAKAIEANLSLVCSISSSSNEVRPLSP